MTLVCFLSHFVARCVQHRGASKTSELFGEGRTILSAMQFLPIYCVSKHLALKNNLFYNGLFCIYIFKKG